MKHEGQVVTILANGPSLLKFIEHANSDFTRLPDEIMTGHWVSVNYSFEKIGIDRILYVFVQEYETYLNVKKVVPHDKLIIPEKPGLNKHGTSARVKVFNDDAYGYTLQDPLLNRKFHLPNKYYGTQRDAHFFSYTSTAQPALHILCYMGFKKIYLVGFDYKKFGDGKIHYDSKHDPNYGAQKMNALQRFKEGDDYLIPRLMQENKVNIINLGVGL